MGMLARYASRPTQSQQGALQSLRLDGFEAVIGCVGVAGDCTAKDFRNRRAPTRTGPPTRRESFADAPGANAST
ncbi:hypothetical protein CI15_26435 [Paraburkholderia monticola]|uniref:Uncharacterized protein n=1 Tax=Paraburkholderia monticola TaxID=1399968 RepID=A0A149PG49_9BURK|nr:hypothetical protein CI15_26435 [Paraburkholderia monticola]